ncbi:integrase, catalytic region, zinc finger, CCHC-type containing protein [Tanacetum coccineum]
MTYPSAPYLNAYSSTAHQDAYYGLAVPVFKQGDDPIDEINKMMSFLSTVVTSCFPSTNNMLINSSNPRQQAVIHDGMVTVQPCFNCQGEGHMTRQCPNPKRKRDATWFRDKVLLVEAQGSSKVLNEEELVFLADPGVAEAKGVLMANLSSCGSDVLFRALGFQNHFYLKKAQQIRPMPYDGTVIAKETNVISIADSDETLMLEEESRSKMLLKQSDPMVLEKKVNIKPVNYAVLNQLSEDYGKNIVDNVAQVSNATTIAPGMYKLEPVALAPKDKNNREAHIYYLKHNMEQAAILREIVEQAKSLNPLDSASYSACKYVKLIQELLGYVRDTFPNIHKPSEKLVAVTPINKKKTVSSMFDARHELCFLEFVSDMNACSKSKSVEKAKKKEEWKPTGKMFTKIRYNWIPTGRTFTLVGNACPLTRITTTNEVPFREPIPLEVVA